MLKNQKQLKTDKQINAQSGEQMELDLTDAKEEKTVVVAINRVTKVVKGGKRFSFNALVVVGDGNGKVGVGLGKSNEVQAAIQKGTAGARKDMLQFPVLDSTIPHEVEGFFGSGHVWMKPAMGAYVDGFYGDAAVTVGVGRVSGGAARLMEVTERSLEEGLKRVKPGARLGDVSSAIGEYAEANGMGVIQEFTGHGVGRKLHEDPSIPNYGMPGTGPVLKVGMTLAIEPMLSLGDPDLVVLKDGWTAVTEDGSLSAHFEHSVAVTKDGCEILTKE